MTQARKQNEAFYFMRRNAKLQIGVAIVFLFIILALVGPLLTKYQPRDYVAPGAQPPSSEFWFGTTSFGEDVFTQFVYGLRSTFLVGIVGGGLGTLIGILIGFTAGYRGGIVDEILNMLTNVVLVVPSLVVLLIVAAYLEVRGLVFLSLIHISEPTRLGMLSYAAFCLKKKTRRPAIPSSRRVATLSLTQISAPTRQS